MKNLSAVKVSVITDYGIILIFNSNGAFLSQKNIGYNKARKIDKCIAQLLYGAHSFSC
jgi:hypothetical protein